MNFKFIVYLILLFFSYNVSAESQKKCSMETVDELRKTIPKNTWDFFWHGVNTQSKIDDCLSEYQSVIHKYNKMKEKHDLEIRRLAGVVD